MQSDTSKSSYPLGGESSPARRPVERSEPSALAASFASAGERLERRVARGAELSRRLPRLRGPPRSAPSLGGAPELYVRSTSKDQTSILSGFKGKLDFLDLKDH